jgi:hypothetical protein
MEFMFWQMEMFIQGNGKMAAWLPNSFKVAIRFRRIYT